VRAWKYAKLVPIRSSAAGIKAQGRYDATRANDAGERNWREAVNEYGESEDREAFTAWAEEQAERGRVAHALTLNPGEGRVGKTELEDWARYTLERIEIDHGEPLEYRVWVHDDHSRHAHVHVIVSSEKPIPKELANEARFHAGQAWDEVQEYKRDLEVGRQMEGVIDPDQDALGQPDAVRTEAQARARTNPGLAR
jgi:hypothetical protein